MKSEKKDFTQKIQFYHILLLACVLSPLLVLNSNYVNIKREKNKLNKEKNQLFDKIIYNRKLEEGDTENLDGTDKVCKRGSEELQKYYKTGDLETIGLKKDPIKCEDNEEEYFIFLKKIIKTYLGGGDADEKDEDSNDESHIRNLQAEIVDQKEDLIAYGKHVLPILIFLVIGILSLPGWLICCFCCCCNCCCCCCCKKPGCKIPCFIFTYIFYGLSVAICFYGLSKSNSIFVGLADTECSILRFFDQVLDGEIKEDRPRWAGIDTIKKILNDISTQIRDLKSGTMDQLNYLINLIDGNKTEFLRAMDESGDKFYEGGHYLNIYSKQYTNFHLKGDSEDRILNGRYVLDLIRMFGKKKDSGGFEPEYSILDIWEREYKIVSENADHYIEQSKESFESMIDENSGDILNSLEEGDKTLDEIKGSFNDIKIEISNMIIDNSEIIDEYGKIGFKLVFSVLGLMNIALGVFVLFICLCSGKMCTKCCCCRCIFKLFTHLLWNILAILMFIAFMVGFIFSIIGQIGNDSMNLISFIVSEDNLGKNGVGGENILVNQLGDSKKYMDRCINGDGKIEEELNIDLDQLDSFDQVKDVEEKIEETKAEFEEKKTFVAYNNYKNELEQRIHLRSENLMLVKDDATMTTEFEPSNISNEDKNKYLIFNTELSLMNALINLESSPYNDEQWDINEREDSPNICGSESETDIVDSVRKVFYPFQCKPLDRDWIFSSTNTLLKNEADVLTETLKFIENAKNTGLDNGYLNIIENLKQKYEKYLDQYIITLEEFGKIINGITGTLKQYINKDDGIFSFVKCNFLGTNLKVILKYLKSVFGKDIKTVGICLSIVGCSLALSISSTILLIVVINIDIENNKKLKEQENKVPEFPTNSEGRIIRYRN